jgi:enoyl-CoA hydratase
MGLINRLCPADALDTAVRSLADDISGNAPLSIRAAKLAIDELMARPEHPDQNKIDAAVAACFESTDYAEGRRAFLEKRKPKFEGK